MEDENIFKPISEGIQDGFKEIGFDLSDREKKIIYLTVKSTVVIVESFIRSESKMKRDEKILFLIQAIIDIEGVRLESNYFEDWSDEKIDDEVDWMEYLLTK